MDFGLNEEQELLKTTVRRFLTDRCPTTRVREIMETDTGHDESLWAGLVELGVTALLVPEQYGGLGSELLELALISEELGYGAAPGPFLGNAMATVALTEGLADGGDANVIGPWLERIGAGEALGTVAIGEDDGIWSADKLSTKAGGGRLTGSKPLVPYAAASDVLVVAARDDSGPGLWLVETGSDGVETVSLEGSDMTRRLDAVTFADAPAVKVGGAEALSRTFDAGLILLAADAYGGASRCLEMTCQYALEREQFGQVIGAFQAVKHQLADMASRLEPSLSMYWYAAHAFDHLKDEVPRHAAMVKAYLADLYDLVARESTELHGGIGFTWEFDLHLWFRRAIFDRSYLGEAAYHRARAADLAGW